EDETDSTDTIDVIDTANGTEQGPQLDHDWAMPDLIIIDGGKGQLSAAMEVLQELHIDVPTVGLAKENEEIFTPGSPEPIMLPRTSQSLYLVQRIRDEAHRFGITYHRKLRSNRTFKSVLDEIPGIGPKRKQALMKHFGSVKAISAASIDDLAALDGMTRDAAEKVKEYIGRMG
ncbi:MAG: helix-hairpin-helix domain-containing protein, partial [Ktedonobacteraceae bacterium]